QEKTLSSTYIYRGKLIKLRQDKVKLPDGRETIREIVEHPGAVVILALTDDNKVVMILFVHLYLCFCFKFLGSIFGYLF
ncbi:unnamed protein product, partial [marine sediment metagenome]